MTQIDTTIKSDAKRLVKVTNLDSSVSEEKLHDFFEFAGAIERIEMNDGSALILYANETSATTATLLTRAKLGNQEVNVAFYHTQQQSSEKPTEKTETAQKKDEHAHAAHSMVSEWIANGVVMTEQLVLQAKQQIVSIPLVKKGIDGVTPYVQSAVQTAKPYVDGAVNEVKKIDTQYHISERVTQGTQNVQHKASETVNSLSAQYPIVKNVVDQAGKVGAAVNDTVAAVGERRKEQADLNQMQAEATTNLD